jgi:hypothetical protein
VGAVQEIVTWPFPGVATSAVGEPGIARILKEIPGEVALVNPTTSVIVAEIVHVPVLTKATKPEVELTVQTEVVAEVKVIVPVPTPAVGVAVNVGGVPVRAYPAR